MFYSSSTGRGSAVDSYFPVVIYPNADTQKLQILQENKGKSGIYLWENNITGKKYIGSSNKLDRRLSEYYNINYLNKHSNMIINRSLLKYGYSNFTIKILEYCDSVLLHQRENYYFRLIVPEYNIAKDATSPMLNKKHSEEAKAKISAIKKGQTLTEETKAKISAGNKGKTYSKETIYKISLSKKGENHPKFGKTHSEETLIKMAKVKIGKKHSAETLVKMSNAKKGIVRPEGAGTPEKKLSVWDLFTNKITVYKSRSAAAEAMGINRPIISIYAKSQKPYKRRYIFSYRIC